MRTKSIYLTLMVLLMVFSVACTPETAGTDNQTASKDDNGSNETSQSRRSDVVIAMESDAVTMLANTDVNYVNDAQIRNIYDPLIARDEEGKPVIPVLATEWKNIDELTWEFTLREGVTFHNGEPFNAEAV